MNSGYDYRSKVISIEEALTRIHSGDLVVSALGGAEPKGILEQLHTIADRVSNPQIHPEQMGSDHCPVSIDIDI